MEKDYSFNGNDYDFTIRITNGKNNILLKPEAWGDLYIEENIFDWPIRGSIVIKSPYDTFERRSDEALAFGPEEELIYKFRNDGRDTIFISIFPKDNIPGSVGGGVSFQEKLWRLELEATIYDVKDLDHTNITNKQKKLYFWDKTYQMMLEKNIEFTTAIVGENKGKQNIHKLNNEERSLKTGEALGELLKGDEEFSKHAKLVDDEEFWNKGSDKNKVFYTSLTNYTFNDDMNYILMHHTTDEDMQYQPCIFRMERAEAGMTPRQFSLIPIKKYFEKAGNGAPGEYQLDHYFLEESTEGAKEFPPIPKAPIAEGSISTEIDVKGEDYSKVANFTLVDFSGADYSRSLLNRFIASYNTKEGQFNIEIKEHKTEKFKEFYDKNIKPHVMTSGDERLPLTKYITESYNSKHFYSEKPMEFSRIVDGRNKLLKYYMFTNLGISFSTRGMTIRQPGRFFGFSKRDKNDKDYDDLLEGQYFTTDVIHHFDNQTRTYSTQIVGIKVHRFKDTKKLSPDDVILIQ